MNTDGIIDFSKLEKELFAAVEEDARYQRENDAKFRAVEQKVASYEEFKDIVAASHLRPLEKKDSEGLHNRKQPWNQYADKQSGKALQNTDNLVPHGVKVPKNSHEFLQHWRQYGSDKSGKYSYLCEIGSPKLCEIFKAEIAMGLLGEITDVLYENWNAVDVYGVYQILYGLSGVKRFDLSLQFLSSHEKQTIEKLFSNLEDTMKNMKVELDTRVTIDENSLRVLKESYGIKS